MITKLLLTSCLVAVTVVIHASGLGIVLSHVLHSPARTDTRFWPITWLLIRVAWLLIVIHLFAIALWAVFFWSANVCRTSSRPSTFRRLPTPRSGTVIWSYQESGGCLAQLRGSQAF